MSERIYLDNNSTTAILPEVVDAIAACLRHDHKNPASQHESGRKARRVLEEARETIGTLLGAKMAAPDQDQIIFTSGGTEANNLAIRGLLNEPGDILVSSIEHASALEAAKVLKSQGYRVRSIPVDCGGHVLLEKLSTMINDETKLVCVMMGNNETGTLQPISEISRICRFHHVPVHCDAVQTVGKLRVRFDELGVTSLAFSAHKFHGPRGIGGLVLKSKTALKPLVVGGSQQLGSRPGTEPLELVVGMAKALSITSGRNTSVESLRNLLQSKLLRGTKCVVNGTEPRLAHTLNVAFPGVDRQALVMALDLAGIDCATGSACTSGSSEPSHVLIAMGLPPEVINSSIRFSLSRLNTESETIEAADRILSVVNDLQHRN